jgi:hypothetical protein
MDEDPHYRPLVMPRIWRWWHGGLAAAVMVAAMTCAFLRADSVWWYLPLALAIIIGVIRWARLEWLVRCPRCSRKLRPRKVDELYRPKGTRRFLYDCPDCQVTWDPHYIEEPASE